MLWSSWEVTTSTECVLLLSAIGHLEYCYDHSQSTLHVEDTLLGELATQLHITDAMPYILKQLRILTKAMSNPRLMMTR